MLTLRPRVGFTFDNLLLYATGGATLTSISFKHQFADDILLSSQDSGESFSETETKWGWVAGGGAEFAINDRWSLGVEYLYTDLGSVNETRHINDTVAGPLNTVFKNELDLTVQTVRAAFLNFRL